MANTPEGKVKKAVTKVLVEHLSTRGGIYWFMPVPGGYGQSSLDYLGCANGRFFAIETKAPGKKPTPRQETMMDRIRAGGGRVFVIDGDTTELKGWLVGLME